MTATDVSDTLQIALQTSGLDRATVVHRPRLLSDNGPSYISAELGTWLEGNGMAHTRGRPYHPQTQGKIERYHRTLKNTIKLDHYYSPDELRYAIEKFIWHYNNERYHESLGNLTPASVYNGESQLIVEKRAKIRARTFKLRRKLYEKEKQLNLN